MKYILFEPEALADFLLRGSASASGPKSQGIAMQILPCVILWGNEQQEVSLLRRNPLMLHLYEAISHEPVLRILP